MGAIDRLIQRSRESRRRIAFVGDTMLDVWLHGRLEGCQDHCPAFKVEAEFRTPGGAANAARQLRGWNVEACLLGLYPSSPRSPQVNYKYTFQCDTLPCKRRLLDNGRIVFRQDEDRGYGLDRQLRAYRQAVLGNLRHASCDAVLISDYEKGFLDEGMIRAVIRMAVEWDIPVIADAKRELAVYTGAITQTNLNYRQRWLGSGDVNTNGAARPFLDGQKKVGLDLPPVPCCNHVGAGDCFAAHLALGLAHGLSLAEAVNVAYSAGRVYVQHPQGRPPWPHEIRKDMDPVGGKILRPVDLAALRQSVPGRVVFTNGVFRLPHAGHAWGLQWARDQGGVLVVGVNDQESTDRLCGPGFALPERQRLHQLASLSCVDWLVPFGDDTPCDVIRLLQPDLLVKGHEYEGRDVPGADLVPQVRFAPPDVFPDHSSDLVAAIRTS